ncbi:hypothetical protein MRX96_044010 [Rhipicephalus microplus]
MWISSNIFIVLFMLKGNHCAVQRYPFSNAFGVSPLNKPNKHLPSCDDILRPDYPRTSCYYQCYSSKKQIVKGTHNDGTRCEKEKFPGRRAHCIRSICILIENEVPKFDSSKPEQKCDGQYYGKGYATSCQYTCTYFGKRKHINYSAGTPCVILDEYKDRVNSVGICHRGICKPFYKLESTNSKIKNKIFAKQYRKCEEVEHYGVSSCQYNDAYNSELTTARAITTITGGTFYLLLGQVVENLNLILALSPQQHHQAHPPSFIKCPEKEHTGRTVLSSCYYYCNTNGGWFAGHYDSNTTSACYLTEPLGEQNQGWCCKGTCIPTYYCGER